MVKLDSFFLLLEPLHLGHRDGGLTQRGGCVAQALGFLKSIVRVFVALTIKLLNMIFSVTWLCNVTMVAF